MDVRYERLKRLYLDVCDLDAEKRKEFLDQACSDDPGLRAEVESLVGHGGLPTAAFPTPPSALEPPRADAEDSSSQSNGFPAHVGPYRIIRRIGHGGMGVVYLGERDEGRITSFVAVKIIRRGMDTEEILRRFEQERQVLAALDDPCIARLKGAGETTDGLPYFATEYVEGVAIDKYSDDNRLSVSERLKLFRRVCAAVHHAHKNLVVHRDLKPGHILVTRDGLPKLLDFGIAKLLNPSLSPLAAYPTAPGLGFMTPEYASPEQVRGGLVGLPSDVYALGVILYELLTGHRPYRLRNRNDKAELERVICEGEPARPSTAASSTESFVEPTTHTPSTITPEMVSRVREGRPDRLRRRLSGDIDNIILKALRKRPDERYASAEQLGEDIQRHLDGMPVTARPDSFGYRATKFMRRHRFGVASAAAIAFAMLFGTTFAAWGRNTAIEQRQVADQRFEQVLDLAETFLYDFHDAIVDLEGSLEARQLVAETALAHLDGLAREVSLDNEPELTQYLALGYNKVGDILGSHRRPSLGDLSGALDSHLIALPLWRSLVDRLPDDGTYRTQLSMCQVRIGDMLKHLGKIDEAVEAYQTALSILDHVTDPDPRRRRAIVLKSLSDPLLDLGRNEEAERGLLRALELCRAVVADDPQELHRRDLSVAFANLGELRQGLGQHERALRRYKEAIDIREELLLTHPDSPRVRKMLAKALLAAGHVHLELDQPMAARDFFERSHDIFWQRANDNRSDITAQLDFARADEAVGQAEVAMGNHELALNSYGRFQSTMLSIASKDDDLTVPELLARSHLRIGEVLALQDDRDAARESFRQALDLVMKLATRGSQSASIQELDAEIREALTTLDP